MYAVNVHQLGSVSGGQWSDTPYTGPGKLGQLEAGQTGRGDNESYGGATYTFDDGSTLTVDGLGNVLGGIDSRGHWFNADSVEEYARIMKGGMSDKELEDFAIMIDWLLNGWRGR